MKIFYLFSSLSFFFLRLLPLFISVLHSTIVEFDMVSEQIAYLPQLWAVLVEISVSSSFASSLLSRFWIFLFASFFLQSSFWFLQFLFDWSRLWLNSLFFFINFSIISSIHLIYTLLWDQLVLLLDLWLLRRGLLLLGFLLLNRTRIHSFFTTTIMRDYN